MRDAGISVSTDGLDRAAWTVGQAAASAARLAQGVSQGRVLCSNTGGHALDAALEEFAQTWSRALQVLDADLSLLSRFLTAAAADYRSVDALVVSAGPP